MRILPKTEKEALDFVYNVLNQGDSRYNDPENESILSYFIMNEAIFLEEREIPEIKEPTDKELGHLLEVQVIEKYLAKILLKREGFNEEQISFERSFFGSRPDVFAEKQNKTILVECRSCRISKVITYLLEADEVWIITSGFAPWSRLFPQKEKMQWFVFRKGSNWNEVLKFEKKKLERLKKVKSPLDRIKGI